MVLFFIHLAAIASAAEFSTLTVVIFDSGKLPALIDAPIDQLRVIASKDGRWSSIPFQVDKINEEKEYLFPGDRGAERKTLKPQDEWVFQAQDMGDDVSTDLPDAKGPILRVKAVKANRTGVVYIGRFKLPKSKNDYVSFQADSSGVVSSLYSVGCAPNNSTFFTEITMGGVDHLDRVKLRAEATLRFGGIHLERNEEDIRGLPVEVIDGQVRVLQRITYSVRIIGNIHSPTLSRVTKSYKSIYHIPNDMNVPIAMDTFFKNMNSIAGYDFTPEISGARIYCSKCGDGFTVNGKMDDFEFSDTGLGSRTMAICSDYGSMITAVRADKEVDMLPVKTGGIYIDNASETDAPEDVPGKYGWFGYSLKGLEKVPKGKYHFNLVMLFPGRCPGNENLLSDVDAYFNPPTLTFSLVTQ